MKRNQTYLIAQRQMFEQKWKCINHHKMELSMNKVGISPFVGKFFFVFWKLQQGKNIKILIMYIYKREIIQLSFFFDIETLKWKRDDHLDVMFITFCQSYVGCKYSLLSTTSNYNILLVTPGVLFNFLRFL